MWSFNAGASWITDSQRRIVDGTPEFDTAGVVNYPPKFKGRLGASWSRSNFSVTGTVNHLSGVWNTALMPNIKGDSMTTMDVVFRSEEHTSELQSLMRISYAVFGLNKKQ